MEINGVAHVMLTVSDYEACLPFYEKLLPFLGTDVRGAQDRLAVLLYRRPHRDGHPQGRGEIPRRALCARARRIASRLPARARAQRRRRGLPVPVRASAPRSSIRPTRAHGRRATTPCCSRTPTASGSKSITSRARAAGRRRRASARLRRQKERTGAQPLADAPVAAAGGCEIEIARLCAFTAAGQCSDRAAANAGMGRRDDARRSRTCSRASRRSRRRIRRRSGPCSSCPR